MLGKLESKFLNASAQVSSSETREDSTGDLIKKTIRILAEIPSPLSPALKGAVEGEQLIDIWTDPDSGIIKKIADSTRELVPSQIDLVLDLGEALMDSAAGEIGKDLAGDLWELLKNPPPKDPLTGQAQEIHVNDLPSLETGRGGAGDVDRGGRISRQRKDYAGTPEINSPNWSVMVDVFDLKKSDIEAFRDQYYESDGSLSFKEFTEKKLTEKQTELKVGRGDEITGKGSALWHKKTQTKALYDSYKTQNASSQNIINQILNLKDNEEIVFSVKKGFNPTPLLFLLAFS